MRIVFYIFLLLISISCEKKTDFFSIKNTEPSLTISVFDEDYTTEITDSVKIGIPLVVNYTLQDDKEISLLYENVIGEDSISIFDNFLNIYGQIEGSSHIKLIARDYYDKESISNIYLTVFNNLLPTAKLDISQIAIVSPYEVSFNASNSFDKDERFGGAIINYEYTIHNDSPVITTRDNLNYIFSSPGQKKVTLRVKDNNDEWSEEISRYFIVN